MEKLREKEDITFEQDVKALENISARLGWIARRRFEQELAAFNVTVPQYMALRCIQDSEYGCNMTELAESSNQVSATMTGIVDRLVDRGLVARERDLRDRRANRVVLTSEGRHLLVKISKSKRAWIEQFFATLSPEERRLMIDMGTRYLALIEPSLNSD